MVQKFKYLLNSFFVNLSIVNSNSSLLCLLYNNILKCIIFCIFYNILEKLNFHEINLFNILLGYPHFLQFILNTCPIFIVLFILSTKKPLLIDKIKLLYSYNIFRISDIFCYIIFLFIFIYFF
jgi:hypothetical protein